MGSSDNIINSTFEHLSKEWGKSLLETKVLVKNLLEKGEADKDAHLKEMFEKAASAWGQSVEEAKSNTLKLLKKSK